MIGTLCSVMMSMLLSLPQPARWSTYNVTLTAQGTGIISTVNGTEHITAISAEFREFFDCTSRLLSFGAVSAELRESCYYTSCPLSVSAASAEVSGHITTPCLVTVVVLQYLALVSLAVCQCFV